MSDQVERLRKAAAFVAKHTGAENAQWIYDAADEIDAMIRTEKLLRTEIKRLQRLCDAADRDINGLRTALKEIAGPDPKATLDEPDPDWEVIRKMRAIARATLALSSNKLSP